MTWDTTQPVTNLYYKTSLKAWRHPSNTNGTLRIGAFGTGGVQIYTSEILPTGTWVSLERYWVAAAGSVLTPLAITDGAALLWTQGGPVWLSDIVVSQAADIVTWQRSVTAGYSVNATDIGKRISITTGGISISTNLNSAAPVGSWFEVYNNSDVAQQITCSVTLRLAASGTTGTRTLAGRGIAIINKTNTSEWLIHGAGVT